jgi:transposase
MDDEVHHTTTTSGLVGGFHSVTLIEGSARRRRFSAEEKARIVAASLDPAVSVSAVARRHGINPNQLFMWRRLFRDAAARRRGEGDPAASGDPQPADKAEPQAPGDTIEIVVGRLTIRVRSGVNVPVLRRVLAAVESLR